MPGDLVTFDVGAAILERVAIEVARITAILAAINELHAADLEAKSDGLSEAGEFLALERLTNAEERLLELIADPGFARCQKHLLKGLTGFAKEAG